jgi:general secretion pathway protein B
MSYILEALKKAQAERQLGNAPTIHAPQTVQVEQPGVAASRKPLFIGLGAGALVVLLGGLFMWQRTPAPAVPAAASTATPAAAAPSLTPAVPAAPERAPAAPSLAANAASNTLEVSAPPAPPPRPAHVAETPARPAASPTVPPAPAVAAPRPNAAPASAPSPEDSLPYLHQLPDNMQRDIPRVAFGGYMYSANPADRLLLVDKTLRHEGEEVAPGLVLEKLLPKAAVMNYRGVRYRVAY